MVTIRMGDGDQMISIENALQQTTDTKACLVGAGAAESAAKMFRGIFPRAKELKGRSLLT